jgi:hypothetical protein
MKYCARFFALYRFTLLFIVVSHTISHELGDFFCTRENRTIVLFIIYTSSVFHIIHAHFCERVVLHPIVFVTFYSLGLVFFGDWLEKDHQKEIWFMKKLQVRLEKIVVLESRLALPILFFLFHIVHYRYHRLGF